jgi:hypothetical protein
MFMYTKKAPLILFPLYFAIRCHISLCCCDNGVVLVVWSDAQALHRDRYVLPKEYW